MILEWLVGEQVTENICTNQYVARKEDICNPLPDNIASPEVVIDIVKSHFQRTAWTLVDKYVKRIKKENYEWMCQICIVDLGDSESVQCDVCLSWFHLKCLGRTKTPATKLFFCRSCKKTENKKEAQQ